MERSTSSHLVPQAVHIVILQLDSWLIVEVKKRFACITDLEVVMDHAGNLSSFQELIVLLCPFALPCRLAS